jgi:hypothetical protein
MKPNKHRCHIKDVSKMETKVYNRVAGEESLEEPVFGKASWNELQQHEPLAPKVEKGAWLQGMYPTALKVVSAIAHNKSTEHLHEIERVSGAEAQYALLIHYHKVLGTIPHIPAAKPMTIQEEIEAFNLYQSGLSLPVIADKLNRAQSTIWRSLAPAKSKPKLKYHHVRKHAGAVIDKLYSSGVAPLDIAKQTGLPYRTVRYYIFEKSRKNP